MHGEQGALLCTAKIVETVPWIDAKYYASTQVMDEARHVEVFAKYLDTKLSGHYPINAHLKLLLDDIVTDSRWDMTYLGMQIMVEGLALAAFGFIHQLTTEPLLKQLLRYVMSDEARHVAFGVLSLKEYYAELSAPRSASARSSPSRRPCACATGSCSRRCGIAWACPVKEAVSLVMMSPEQQLFQQLLFSKIVPNCKKLGLLDAGADKGQPGWLRQKFGELGVIQFEDWADTDERVRRLRPRRRAGLTTSGPPGAGHRGGPHRPRRDRPVLDQLLADRRSRPRGCAGTTRRSTGRRSPRPGSGRTWDYTGRHLEFLAWVRRVGGGAPSCGTRPRWWAGTATSPTCWSWPRPAWLSCPPWWWPPARAARAGPLLAGAGGTRRWSSRRCRPARSAPSA